MSALEAGQSPKRHGQLFTAELAGKSSVTIKNNPAGFHTHTHTDVQSEWDQERATAFHTAAVSDSTGTGSKR